MTVSVSLGERQLFSLRSDGSLFSQSGVPSRLLLRKRPALARRCIAGGGIAGRLFGLVETCALARQNSSSLILLRLDTFPAPLRHYWDVPGDATHGPVSGFGGDVSHCHALLATCWGPGDGPPCA